MEKELWKYLKTAKKPIVLYGMGNGADKIIAVLRDFGIDFSGVFASDSFVRNKTFHGHSISTYSQLKEKFGDMIVLLCFGSGRPEVIENILKISAEQEFYAPEVPVIGGGLFCQEYLERNRDAFQFTYNLLADDISRKTFENIVKYKLSGKIEYLLDCQVEEDEPYNSFLRLSYSECFMDLGAYNGDTVTDFIHRVDNYRQIIAVEPDTKSFKKLLNNTSGFKNIRYENVGISDFCGNAQFGMRGGRNSGVSNGNSEIPFSTVDSLAQETAVTFIKMDVEGEEKNAVLGAEKTILKHKPKMLISCYHRTEDLIALPKAVFDIRKDYRLYMRHFSSIPAWDTNYYFI